MSSYRVVGENAETDTAAVIAAAVGELLGTKIAANDFAKNYQAWFLKLTEKEFTTADAGFFERGLARLQSAVVSETGTPIAASLDWDSDLVTTVVINGAAVAQTFQLGSLPIADWVNKGIAEPDLLALPREAELQIPVDQVLFAVGAGAEYGPVPEWLNLGGHFAAVMRPNFSRWRNLIAAAQASGGTLLVPVLKSKLQNCGPNFLDDLDVLAEVAGLDAVEDLSAVSGWLREISSRYSHTTLGLWGYAPGPKHLVLQAAMDALAAMAMNKLSPAEITLNWLGTPTDSVFIDPDSAAPVLVDASVKMQGPNYLWAKRSQRWRAELAHRQGYRTAYLVLPPAYTNSVLSYRSLRIAYAGAAAVGIHPFKMDVARRTAVGLLLWVLHQPQPAGEPFHATRYAVTGGLWRLGAAPGWRWKWAIVIGLFRPWWRVKPAKKR